MKYDIEKRLLDFSLKVIEIVEALPNTKAANYLGGQIIRSRTSPALNYAEAQSAESRNDFVYKMKICLKELRENFAALKIINYKNFLKQKELLVSALNENNELIAIFVKSILTAKKNK